MTMRTLGVLCPRLVGAVALLGCLAGCSGGAGMVSGTVTYRPANRKVVWGTVMLLGQDGKVRYGTISPDGTYRVANVPAGAVKVTVNSPSPRANGAARGRGDLPGARVPIPGAGTVATVPAEVLRAWFPIPEKFGDPTTSGLTTTVKRGEGRFDIVLD